MTIFVSEGFLEVGVAREVDCREGDVAKKTRPSTLQQTTIEDKFCAKHDVKHLQTILPPCCKCLQVQYFFW